MPLQSFVDNNLPTIKAAWLNAVDVLYFTVFNQAATVAEARTALSLTPGTDVIPWATPGTAGNVLTSDGANWVSSVGTNSPISKLSMHQNFGGL